MKARCARGKIDEKTARVHFLDSTATATGDILNKYANLRAAVREAAENQILLKQLKTIHPPSVPDMTPGYTLDRIRKELADAAKQIRRIREPGEAGRPCRRKAKPKVSRVTR